jgi:hypothetical protein
MHADRPAATSELACRRGQPPSIGLASQYSTGLDGSAWGLAPGDMRQKKHSDHSLGRWDAWLFNIPRRCGILYPGGFASARGARVASDSCLRSMFHVTKSLPPPRLRFYCIVHRHCSSCLLNLISAPFDKIMLLLCPSVCDVIHLLVHVAVSQLFSPDVMIDRML